jgi:hypothetical protein
MTNPFMRGSAPGRARDARQRPGCFQKGHKKLGGRKRGTPNKRTREYKGSANRSGKSNRERWKGQGRPGRIFDGYCPLPPGSFRSDGISVGIAFLFTRKYGYNVLWQMGPCR